MKKFLRSVMTLGLAVGLLSGCKGTTPVEKHTVFFWMGPTESLYKEVEVEHGKKVEKPTDPTKEGFTFIDWYADKALATKFDFDKAVEEDLDVYAKWSRDYVPSDKVLSIVGELKNSDIDWVSWPVDATNPDHYDERSFLTKADDSNVFSITLEIGYNGAFKILVLHGMLVSNLNGNMSDKSKKEQKFQLIWQNKDLETFKSKTAVNIYLKQTLMN